MSVEAIRLKNFMAFQDTDWIELRPITLLFGKNSSGKSVIGRALRLLKQSLEAETGSGPFVYATRRGVDVGGFETMIHTSPGSPDWRKPVIFAFRCQLADTLDLFTRLVNQQRWRERLPAIPASLAQDQVELWLQYEWNEDLERAWLTELKISYPSHTEQSLELIIFAAYRLDHGVVIEGEDEWWFHSDILHGHEADSESAWVGVRIELASGFLPTLATPEIVPRSGAGSSDDLRFVVALLRELRQTVEQFLRRTDYLGPLRPEPEREFVFDAQRIRHWQDSGLRGYLQYLRGEVDQSVMDEIDSWLRAVGLCQRARPVTFYSFPERALVAGVDIHEEEKEEPRNLADTGFGLSQALPVIIQCLASDGDSTLLIEQPELHLHPSAQATLTDLFIARAGRVRRLIREREERRLPPPPPEEIESLKVRFLVETHSEHVLLRLQRRIAESTQRSIPQTGQSFIVADDVAIYFVHRKDGVSQMLPAQPDSLGEIELPAAFRDFFADDVREVALLAGARLGLDLMTDEERKDASSS